MYIQLAKRGPISLSFLSLVSNIHKPRSRSRSKERGHGADFRDKPSRRSRSPSWNRSRSRSPHRRRSYSRTQRSRSRSPSARHRSKSPSYRGHTDESETVTDTFIRAVVAEIKGQGSGYEQNLRLREQNNPKYAFLRPDVGFVRFSICNA